MMSQSSRPILDRLNTEFANGRLITVTDRPLPIALRELRDDFSNRTVLVGMLAVGLILGVSGPFDTIDALSLMPRLFYWLVVVVLTFATGSLISTVVHTMLDKRIGWLAYVVSTLAIGLGVTAIVGLINLVVIGVWSQTWSSFLEQLGVITLICGVIEFSSFAIHRGKGAEVEKSVPLLDRLPFDKRGKIVALSAEDHYVRIATTKGTELVLMRLSDAVREVGDTPGLQIHRSHWIATDQAKKVTRVGDRAEVSFEDGTTLPVSRGYMAAAREAGLLPAKRGG